MVKSEWFGTYTRRMLFALSAVVRGCAAWFLVVRFPVSKVLRGCDT